MNIRRICWMFTLLGGYGILECAAQETTLQLKDVSCKEVSKPIVRQFPDAAEFRSLSIAWKIRLSEDSTDIRIAHQPVVKGNMVFSLPMRGNPLDIQTGLPFNSDWGENWSELGCQEGTKGAHQTSRYQAGKLQMEDGRRQC